MTASGVLQNSAQSQASWPAAGRVWFGGVDFRFVDAAAFRTDSIPTEARDGQHDLPCAAAIEAEAPRGNASLSRHGVRWSWSGDRATLQLQGHGPRAELFRGPDGRYAAHGPDTADAQDFLTCLLWPALLREGGLVLHACAVEYAGGAVLFVGPSGAGKSTAATLLRGARLLAKDVVSVFPARDRIWVAALPGGTAPACALPPSPMRCLPLLAVLRVVQSRDEPSIARRRGASASSVVMGALRHGAVDVDGHTRMLASASVVSSAAQVGDVYTVLERDLSPALDAFLETPHD